MPCSLCPPSHSHGVLTRQLFVDAQRWSHRTDPHEEVDARSLMMAIVVSFLLLMCTSLLLTHTSPDLSASDAALLFLHDLPSGFFCLMETQQAVSRYCSLAFL